MQNRNLFISICAAIGITIAPISSINTFPTYAIEESEIEGIKNILISKLKEAEYSNAAIAGILANIEYESNYDHTLIQGGRKWEQFVKGVVGIGLMQWTNADTQDKLFEMAENQNKTWDTIDLQIDFLIKDLEETEWWKDYYDDLADFKKETEYQKATKSIMKGYVKPATQTLLLVTERVELAKDIFNELEPKQEIVEEEVKQEKEKEIEIERKEIVLEEVEKEKEDTKEKETNNAEIEQSEYVPLPVVETEPVITYADTNREQLAITETTEKAIQNATPYTGSPTGYGKVEVKSSLWNPYTVVEVLGGFALVIFGSHKGYAFADKAGFLINIQDKIALYKYKKKRGTIKLPKNYRK